MAPAQSPTYRCSNRFSHRAGSCHSPETLTQLRGGLIASWGRFDVMRISVPSSRVSRIETHTRLDQEPVQQHRPPRLVRRASTAPNASELDEIAHRRAAAVCRRKELKTKPTDTTDRQ